MFLSSSYPEINKSPSSDKSQDQREQESRLESSLLDDDGHYEGDQSDSSNLSNYNHFLTSSLPDLGTPSSSNRRKKRRKKRLSETENDLAIQTKTRRAASLTLVGLSLQDSIGRPDSELPTLKTHCDLTHAIGRRRGIAGSSKASSYLDVTLFTLFFFTDIFDEWLLNDGRSKGFPTPRGKEVRSVLRKEIIYSLRTSYFCPSEKVTKLHKLLFGTAERTFIEIRSFLVYFFESVLNVTESIHFTNGISEVIHTFVSSKAGEDLTVQDLFQSSLKFSGPEELTLLSIPYPALILSVKNPLVTPHSALIPNIQLDISKCIIHLADDTDDTHDIGSTKSMPPSKCKHDSSESSVCRYFKTFCRVVYEYLQNLVIQFPGLFTSAATLDDSWATGSQSSYLISPEESRTGGAQFGDSGDHTLESGSTLTSTGHRRTKQPAKVQMDLMAVICLSKEKHYTAFVRCGQNPRRGWAPWVIFDPLEQGAPLVRKIEDCGKWLSRLEKNPSRIRSMRKIIPQDIHQLLTESTLFIYNTKPNYESQNTLFSFLNETQ